MKTRRLLSAVMSVVMVFTMFTVLTLTVPLSTSATTDTEKAIFIGSTSKITAAFIPMDITQDNDGSTAMTGTHYYKLSFKCKMLKNGNNSTNPGMPSIGITHTQANVNEATETDPAWAGSGYNTYNVNNGATLSDGVYSMRFMVNYDKTTRRAKLGDGNRSFYITIGNAASRGTSQNSFVNYGASFIFSGISLYECDSDGSNVQSTNYIPQINSDNVDFRGTYFQRGDCATTKQWDGEEGAEAMKWHVLSQPDYVKEITVPSDYNTSSSYDAANFTKQGDTEYIREYYTNDNYSDLKFAKLADSDDAGFEVIPDDVNKKMIIIDANHENEADSNTGTGVQYKPTKNKPANIFIPICFSQYNTNQYGYPTCTMSSATYPQPQGGDFLAKVTMKAVRLEGEGSPVLGRLTGYKTGTSGNASSAHGETCYNIDTGDYYANPTTGNESIYDESGNRITYTYNPATGYFEGWLRVRGHDNDYCSRWGVTEILTIGNSEHVNAEGTFDSTSFNSSFAISDIKVDVYAYSSSKKGDLIAEDIAPHLYADTVDDTSNWAYQCKGSNAYSNHANDLIRSSQYKWCVDGCTGMVHAVNLTNCMKNSGHTITAHAATSTTCEYYSCSSCGKNYAEPYCETELSSTAATNQMIILNSSGSNIEAAFMTARLGGFTGNQWFKFTCKVKRIAGSGDPVVGILYATYDGNYYMAYSNTSQNDGDYSIAETSYDEGTMTLTAYFKAWNASDYNKGVRYPYRRYNAKSGANIAITVGNASYVRTSGQDEDDGTATVASAAQYTSFAIAEPALYKVNCTGAIGDLATAKSSSVDTSTNYATPITSKTTDVTYPDASSWNTSCTATNNPLTAPKGKWYIMNSRTTNANSIYASSVDIPTNYFTAGYSPSKKMIKFAGANTSNIELYIPFAAVGHLESSTTYQLDYDYREFGGTTHRLEMKLNGSEVTGTTDVANGYHRTVTFETPAGLPLTGADNFRIEIGPQYEIKYEYSLYLSDIKLRKTSDLNGSNYIINGDFALGSVGVINWSNYKSQLPGYANYWLAQYNLGARLLSIPSGFFSGTAMAGDTTLALKATGNTDSNCLYFRTHLAASSYYRLSFKYQFYDTGTNNENARTVPTVDIKCKNSSGTDAAPAASSVTKNSGGNYSYTVNFTTPSSMQNSNSVFQANTTLYINFGSSASNKTIYVTDVELYKLSSSGGSVVSNATGCANLLGNVNAVFDSSLYSGLSSVGNSASVTLGTDNNAGVTSYNMVNGWYKQDGVGSTYLVKVPSDFFDYKTGAQRMLTIRHLILADGEATSDGINPIYNPNGDATWGDVKDLVHTKQAAITNGWS